MQNGIKKLKEKFNEDPITFIVVASLAVTAMAKLVDSFSAAQGRRAYAKQINYKVNRR